MITKNLQQAGTSAVSVGSVEVNMHVFSILAKADCHKFNNFGIK